MQEPAHGLRTDDTPRDPYLLINYSGLDFMLWGERGALTKTAYAGWTWQASGISKGN